MPAKNKVLVTVYTAPAFGGNKEEGALDKIAPARKDSPYKMVSYVPKGKRKAVSTTGGSYVKPFLLVLAGHGHPAPPSSFDGNVTKYGTFDPRFHYDFNAALNPYLETLPPEAILLDQRYTKATVPDEDE